MCATFVKTAIMADFQWVHLTSTCIPFYLDSTLSTKQESNQGILISKTDIIVSD